MSTETLIVGGLGLVSQLVTGVIGFFLKKTLADQTKAIDAMGAKLDSLSNAVTAQQTTLAILETKQSANEARFKAMEDTLHRHGTRIQDLELKVGRRK